MSSKQEPAIIAADIHKDFLLPQEKLSSVKSIFTQNGLFKSRQYQKQHALKGVSFSVNKGEFFGIVGRNGSGKSTLLKILAGIYQPTKGKVHINGKLVPFIELGVGFNPELSGKDNVFLNGAMLGFTEEEVRSKYDSIVDFAELHKFMEQKLKNYSSGMQVRLAFSVATILAESDILLLDEVLAVGDADFQRKCFNYFKTLKKNKKTVVFVSHDMNAVKEYCDRAVLVENGKIVRQGTANTAANEYSKLFINEDQKNTFIANKGKRWGNRYIEFTKVEVPTKLTSDTEFKIICKLTVNQETKNPIIGFSLKSASDQRIAGTNTKLQNQKTGLLQRGDRLIVEWSLPNVLNDGSYFVTVAAETADQVACDWWEDAAKIEVYKNTGVGFIIDLPIKSRLKMERN